MILNWLRTLYYYWYSYSFEAKLIERTNSNETFVIYLSDNED